MATQAGVASQGGRVAAVVSAVALVFSAYSVYETSLRRPELHVFVPPLIQYSSPYNNSNFEVFGIPVTISNTGAREGTVLSLDLEVTNPRTGQTKRFYSADLGRWRMSDVRELKLQPFAPIALAGKSSQSHNILFYSRNDEPVQQIVDDIGSYTFKLMLRTTVSDDLGVLDRLVSYVPRPLAFERVLPVLDHRSFIEGTIAMHAKDWGSSGGAAQ